MALNFLNDGYFAGKVGIGKESPDTPLHVITNTSGYAITIEENSGTEAFQIGVDSVGSLDFFNSKSGTSHLSLIDDGNTTFIGDVTLANGNALRWTSDDVRIEGTTAGDNIKFYVANTEILQLAQSGTLATITGNLRVTGAYYDSNNSPGTANQVLVSTVTGTDWIDGSAIPGVPGGSGTLNTVAMWTPDGDTLGDGPITFSGNNSTFAGGITATYGNFSSAVNALYFRTAAANTDYNLITRNSGGNTLFVQNVGSITNQPIASFQYGNATVAQGTIVLQVSKDKSYFVNCDVGIGTATPNSKLNILGSQAIGTPGTEALMVLSRSYNGGVSWGQSAAFAVGRYNSGSNPSTRLDINLMVGNNADSVLPDTTIMSLQSDGNVGIGTTTPDYDLDVERTATTINDDPTIGIRNAWGGQGNNTGFSNRADLLNSAGAGAVIVRTRARYDASANWGEIGTTTAHDFNIRTSGTHRITVLAGGNVGIGTTGPTDKLVVAGNISIPGAHKIYNGSAADSAGLTFPSNVFRIDGFSGITFNSSTTNIGLQTERMRITNTGNVGINTTSPGEKLDVVGNIKITAALLSNQENTDVDTGTETIASVAIATYTAAFFDFVIKKTTNVRSGTVYACHDGTSVAFTETSTQDLGDTSDVTLSVDISGGNMRLRATTTSDDWSIKSLIRAI